jgi:DNA-binding response OmpR family regulator
MLAKTLLAPMETVRGEQFADSQMPSKVQQRNDGPIILVIEDDTDARRLYADFLRMKGWVVFTAADGRGGLDKTTDLAPDVVVVDLAMPRVDGWTVLQLLKDSSWTAAIPVVVVSALTDARDRAFEAGADAFLTKPCTPQVLWLQLRALLRLRERERSSRERRKSRTASA